jgi:hypothetical protein
MYFFGKIIESYKIARMHLCTAFYPRLLTAKTIEPKLNSATVRNGSDFQPNQSSPAILVRKR